MIGDEDSDDFDYDTSDLEPREPDKFEKRGDPNANKDDSQPERPDRDQK